jgi:hypothetical protein
MCVRVEWVHADVHAPCTEEATALATDAGFVVEQCATDRRLIVNRTRKLQMHRVWLQGKFRKPAAAATTTTTTTGPG